ncbi:MAG: hypothetical protein PHV03_10610, partial [Desulfitobacteriaceae bacterium]|nr:hypothetical protein [Desulfitobacteriaceae bacterium]
EAWDSGGVFRPWVVVLFGNYCMYYAGFAGEEPEPQGIGLASSTDGLDWKTVLALDLSSLEETVAAITDNWQMWFLFGSGN